jgi:hypothetical protein
LFAQNSGSFTWDLRLEKKSSGKVMDFGQSIEVADKLPSDASLETLNRTMTRSDVLRAKISSQADVCFYLIRYGPGRKVTVIGDGRLSANTEQVFDLEPSAASGIDTFYIVMSSKKQDKLENLIGAWKRAPGSRQSNSDLYYETLAIQKADSSLGEPPQKFTISGGTARAVPASASTDPGAPPDGTARYSGRDRYVRIITIKH